MSEVCSAPCTVPCIDVGEHVLRSVMHRSRRAPATGCPPAMGMRSWCDASLTASSSWRPPQSMSRALSGCDALLSVRLCSLKWSQACGCTGWHALRPDIMYTCKTGTSVSPFPSLLCALICLSCHVLFACTAPPHSTSQAFVRSTMDSNAPGWAYDVGASLLTHSEHENTHTRSTFPYTQETPGKTSVPKLT